MNEDFLELIRLMNEHGVAFILVGGYAYIFNAKAFPLTKLREEPEEWAW